MKEEPPVNVWEICVRARSSECETVVVCLNYILSNKKKHSTTVRYFVYFLKMKIPLAKLGERRTISTRPAALASGGALKENHVAW